MAFASAIGSARPKSSAPTPAPALVSAGAVTGAAAAASRVNGARDVERWQLALEDTARELQAEKARVRVLEGELRSAQSILAELRDALGQQDARRREEESRERSMFSGLQRALEQRDEVIRLLEARHAADEARCAEASKRSLDAACEVHAAHARLSEVEMECVHLKQELALRPAQAPLTLASPIAEPRAPRPQPLQCDETCAQTRSALQREALAATARAEASEGALRELRGLAKLFDSLDADATGRVPREAASRAFLAAMGCEGEEPLWSADAGGGHCTLSQLLAQAERWRAARAATGGVSRRKALVLALFRLLDADGDGRVSGADLETRLTAVSAIGGEAAAQEAARTLLAAGDSDGDGVWSELEFARFSAQLDLSAFPSPASLQLSAQITQALLALAQPTQPMPPQSRPQTPHAVKAAHARRASVASSVASSHAQQRRRSLVELAAPPSPARSAPPPSPSRPLAPSAGEGLQVPPPLPSPSQSQSQTQRPLAPLTLDTSSARSGSPAHSSAESQHARDAEPPSPSAEHQLAVGDALALLLPGRFPLSHKGARLLRPFDPEIEGPRARPHPPAQPRASGASAPRTRRHTRARSFASPAAPLSTTRQ
jgi:Ca2+-binding EF-hand superfamily protein